MDRKYLVKQFNTWSVVVEVPKPLQASAGKKRFKKSLETDSLAEANRRKHPYVSMFKREIEEIARAGTDKDAALYRLAAEFRTALDTSDRRWHSDEEGHHWNEHEEELDRLKEKAGELLAEQGSEVAKRFYDAATGQATRISDQYPLWLAEVTHAGQTKSQHKSAIERYLSWSHGGCSIEETNRRKAGEYVSHLLTSTALARRTVKRHLSSLSTFWVWLKSKGLSNENPWLGHPLGKKKVARERKALTDEQILKLLRGRYSAPLYASVLQDLLRLALLHGARLDELCALKTADVPKRDDGYWMKVTTGKTEAAAREIPVHKKAVPIIERRLHGKGEWLFEGLEPGGPDSKRSWYVSKAYGRFRKQVGVDGPLHDFHALRHTFISHMEGRDIAESTVKLLVGHARASMTFGLYSQGERVNLRKAVDKVNYGQEIMKAIALPAFKLSPMRR